MKDLVYIRVSLTIRSGAFSTSILEFDLLGTFLFDIMQLVVLRKNRRYNTFSNSLQLRGLRIHDLQWSKASDISNK
jgi:hypothetical protein